MRTDRSSVRACMLAILLPALAPVVASASPPALIPIQGHLADADGKALDGKHSVKFSLFRVAVGGTAVHAETHFDVALEEGDFVVYLGVDDPLDLDLFHDNSELWLEVVVDVTEVITPRFRLGTVPFAASATHCVNADRLADRPASEYMLASDGVAWSAVSGVPASLLDGDSDVVAGLSCSTGDVVVRSAGGLVCRPLAAADITSGTLSTSRYSAYADLAAESYIDYDNATSLQTRANADIRYVNVGEDVSVLAWDYGVTTHLASAGISGSDMEVATGKIFCALSSATGASVCAISNNGGGSFTLTATGTMTVGSDCAMFCF